MSSKLRASSARMNPNKACVKLNEKNALKSQTKVAPSNVSKPSSRAVLNVRISPENESQNEASSKNRIMLKKDGNSKTRKKSNAIVSPKCSKRTHKVRDIHTVDVHLNDQDRENDEEIKSVITNEILSVTKEEVDSNLYKTKYEMHDTEETFSVVNGDIENTLSCDTADTSEHAPGDLENVCENNICTEKSMEASVESVMSKYNQTPDEHANDKDVNKSLRTVLPSNLIQQRFPLRSKLKKPSVRVNSIPEIKTSSNIPRTKVVREVSVNLSETYPGKESTPRTESTRGGKQHQSKLPSSISKITHTMSNTAESDKNVKLDMGTVSEQSDSSITLKSKSSDVSEAIYTAEASEQILPKVDYVTTKTNTNELARMSQISPDLRESPMDSVIKSNKETNFVSEELSILSTSSSNASSLTTSTADKKKPESDSEKCTKQTGATAKQNVVKHKISSKETKLGKTFEIQRSLRATIKQNPNDKSDIVGTNNNGKVSLKSRQRSVTNETNTDDDSDDNMKSKSPASVSNSKSRSISITVNNRSNSKQTGGRSLKDNLMSTKIDGNARSSSGKIANSRTSTLNRIPKTKSSQIKKDPVPKFTNLDRSISSTSSRESTSRSKSRSTSRSRSSTPNSVGGPKKPTVASGDTSDRKSTTWKSKSSSRDSSSRSRSSTPSVTSSVSDDNRHDVTKTKVVKQRSVTKRQVSKLKIPLRTSIPTYNTMSTNPSHAAVKSKTNSEAKENLNSEAKGNLNSNNNVHKTQGSLSNRTITNNNVNTISAITRNVSVCKPSSVRNSSSRSRSSTPEETSAYVRKRKDCGTTLQKSSASNITKVKVTGENIAKPLSVVAESKNGQVKKVGEMKSRESTSRSRSTTPSSATSSEGSKSSASSATNKTRRIINTKTKTDKVCISRQIECTKQQGSIPNTRQIKRTSEISSRSNKHSPDIKDNKTRKPVTSSSDHGPNSSEFNVTRTTTQMNSSSKTNRSKLPLIASSSKITSRIIPKLQKRQNVQSQITQRESPTTTDKPPVKSATLSIQPSTSIKVAKVTISTENKSSKNVTKTVSNRTIARSVNLKAEPKRNKAFASGNKSGLITSLALVKKDNVDPCLDNESKKQRSSEERETKQEIEDHILPFELKTCGSDLLLDDMDNSVANKRDQGIASDTEQTNEENIRNIEIIGNTGLTRFDDNVQNTKIDVNNAICINAVVPDTHVSEKCNKNESQLKNQHAENLICQGNFDSRDKHMESEENHDWNSTDENNSSVVCDPRFEVSINCSPRRQLSKYNGEHDGAWLDMSREENTGWRSNRSIGESLQNLCQESMSKFYSEMESLCEKNGAYRRNINADDQSNLITKTNSPAEDAGNSGIYSYNDVNVEIIHSIDQRSNNDTNNDGTVILIKNTALNSSDVHVTEVNNYAEDETDKPMLSSGNETSVPSQAYKCQIDKKSEISTFHIDMCTVNSSQQMPINDVSLLQHTEPNDFFNDKGFNIDATTPSGALSVHNTNKRQDKKITFDSTCVLCKRFCPCIQLDIKQQNDVSVCVEVCENCERQAAIQITTKNVNVLNSSQEEDRDDISANIDLDETHVGLRSDLEKIKGVNSAVMNREYINNGTLSLSSDLKTDQQRGDVVNDNTEVLNICNEDVIDEHLLAHNDFNTKKTQKCEIIFPTSAPYITSSIEHGILDWQETFLCDKKSLENNTDIETQVPRYCKINKETPCHDGVCTTVCLCSDENKNNSLNTSMDKTTMDVIADDIARDARGQSDNTCVVMNESKVIAMDKTDVGRYSRYQGIDQPNKLTDYVIENSDDATNKAGLVKMLTLPDNMKKTKEYDTMQLNPPDNTFLVQQNANKQNDESTSHIHCFHEKDGIPISGGHDRSFHGSCISVCFMQKTGKIEHPGENREGSSNVLKHDLSPTNNENEQEIPKENRCELHTTSDATSNSVENVKLIEDTGVPIVSAQVKEHNMFKDSQMSNVGALSDHKPDKNVNTAYSAIGERTTTQNEIISFQNTQDSCPTMLYTTTRFQCEQYGDDHPDMDKLQNEPPSENKHILRDNYITPANLLSNSKQDIEGNVPSVLFPTDELTPLQTDVQPTHSYNIDEMTSVREIGENLPECFDNTNNSGGMFSQQALNDDITGNACAVDNGNLTGDRWAESTCLENQSQNTSLQVEMSVTPARVKDKGSSENQLTLNESLQEHIEVNSVSCKQNDTMVCINEQDFIYTDAYNDYLSQSPTDNSSGSKMDSDVNSGLQMVREDNSELLSVAEHQPNVYSLQCTENRTNVLEQGFDEQLRMSAVTEQIPQYLMLSEQSFLSDSDSGLVQDERIFQSQTEDVSDHISTTGNTVHSVGEETLSNNIDTSDRKLLNNGNVLLLQNFIDPDTCQIVGQSSNFGNSERNISAPSNLQIKLFNEKFDNRACAIDANTCLEINHRLRNSPLSSVKTLQSKQDSKKDSTLQNKGEEDFDLELISGINEGICENPSVVDQNSNVPGKSNVELNKKSETDKSTNEEVSELNHVNESELNTKHDVCSATEDGLSDIGDTFVDAEDSDKTVQIELNDTKENRLSLISVNTSTDSFVDAVESLDDDYLTSSVFRNSREIQNEETLSQNASDVNDASSDISDSIDDLSGWEEFTENIEDIGDINSSEMEINPHKMAGTANKFSVRRSELQHHSSVSRIRTILQDKYNQNTTPSPKRETIISSLNETKKISSTDRLSEPDTSDISKSIFKTGNVYVSGEVKSQSVIVETKNDTSNSDNSYAKPIDELSTDCMVAGTKLANVNDSPCIGSNGLNQNSDKMNSQASVVSRIETALIKRTQRRRRRHFEQQPKEANVQDSNIESNVNTTDITIHTTFTSKDSSADNGCIENITCAHSRHSETSQSASDNMTFNNKATSGNESLSSQNNTDIELNISKIDTSLNGDKHELSSDESLSLHEHSNVCLTGVDNNETSVCLTITTEPNNVENCSVEQVYTKTSGVIIQTARTCNNKNEQDNQNVHIEPVTDSNHELTYTSEQVPSSYNGTPELDDIKFIDADEDSENNMSSQESNEVTPEVSTDLSSDHSLTPNVCITISLENTISETETVKNDLEINDGDTDRTVVEVDSTMNVEKESSNDLLAEDKPDEHINVISIVSDILSNEVNINVESSNDNVKYHDSNEHEADVVSNEKISIHEQQSENDKETPTKVNENSFDVVINVSDGDSNSVSPDDNSSTEIVEESNISVKHALEIERLKLADSLDVRSRKALFDSKRSGRRATIETCSIELNLESDKDKNEEPKPKVTKPLQKSKSFRYEKKTILPVAKDDKTEQAERAVSPVSQKVSDICKSFMTKTKSSIKKSREQSTSKSPVPQRKLMKWVCDHGKWLRIPIDEIIDGQRSEIGSPDVEVVENLSSPDVDIKHVPQISSPVPETARRLETPRVKNQPPPVPQKNIDSKAHKENKELKNSSLKMSKYQKSESVVHRTPMDNVETSDINHSYNKDVLPEKTSDIPNTKCDVDNVMTIQVGPSVTTQLIENKFSERNIQLVEGKVSSDIKEKPVENNAQHKVSPKTFEEESGLTDKVDAKVNDTPSQNNKELTKTDEAEEKSYLQEMKVIGTALEGVTSQDTHMRRQELLFGLLDSYNRRKPRRISNDEISRRCASPIGMRTGYMVDKDDDKKHVKAESKDDEQEAEKAMSIPKIKAIKIQEEIFECKSEYIKANNLKLNDDLRSGCNTPKAKSVLRKSKTFSGIEVFERQHGPQRSESLRRNELEPKDELMISSIETPDQEENDNKDASKSKSVNSKMIDKRARAGLKLQIDKAKQRSRNSESSDSPNRLSANQTPRSQGDRSPNRLSVNQSMGRMRSPDKGPRMQRPKLLSEIVEVEENKDDVSVTCDRHQQQRHLKDRNKPDVQRTVKGSNKRRSLSLPTGTLAFGEARVVFKNGHFTIETMDGIQIDSSRPALYQANTRMSESHLDNNWSMPDSSRDEFSNSRVKSNSRDITASDQNRPPMRRQYGKAALQSYDSSEDVFYNESEILESVHDYKAGLEGESRAFSMGRTSDDVFNESSSSRASDMSVDSYVSDRTDVSMSSDVNDSKKLSSSSLPEQKDDDVKRVMQRAKRTSSFRAAQEAGASRLSGINEDKVHESGRVRSVSVDESQNTDLNKLSKTQSQNPTFLKKVMAKRKSFNENLNMSTFAKQSESAKEFFSKKMTLKGLFKKNKSESSVGSNPLKMDHPSSPPLATFQDDDIASVDTPPGSPYNSNREFRSRRHTSADIYRKSFQPDSSETDSNCPTPTLERSSLSHLSVSTPSTPSHKSGSFTNLTSQSSSHDDVLSIASVSSISSSIHSPPSEQPNKPKTPKPVGASPRRNPSFGSQLSRTGSQSSQRNVINSVTSLDGENYETFTDDAIRDPRCECGNKDTCQKHRNNSSSATIRGSSDSLNALCRFCKQMDYYYKTDSIEQKQLQTKEKHSEENVGFKKDSPARSNLERLGIIAQQADVASSNSNDSGIQRDASVHSSNESIKGIPDGHVRLRRNKSLSPHPDRPKSEIAVRWADGNSGEYDGAESPVKLRHREQSRDRPRPKSDLEDNIHLFDELFEDVLEDFVIEGSSFLSDRMKAFGSEINLQPYCSLRNLYEMRRRDNDKQKNRRMSTPHPIKTRLQSSRPHKLQKQIPLVRSSSMPESLDKIHKQRKMHHLLDFHLDSLSRHMDLDCMSDGSDLSFDQASLQEHSVSVQSSNSQLTSMDEDEDNMTYAEALWDHITLDPEEIGFCAQDVIQVLDMDDKDWWYGIIDGREGWFPANFVRLRVNQDEIDDDDLDLDVTIQNTLMSSPKLRRISMLNKDQARSNVVNEIINAEREYVKHLKDVVEGYIQHARKRTEMFPEERICLIFGNIEIIYEFAQKFLSQLEKCIDVCPHLSEIGQCFLDSEHGFEIYSDYCNNHPSACEELDELCKNSKYKHFFEACRLLQELVEIPLEGFLLTPVQKICKYPLQLAELLKYTPPDHADYARVRDALAAMRKIATLINERKRKMESIEKIAVWQNSVVDWEGPDLLESSSELIFSGELNKINSAGWSQERFFFLFDHQLVYCKKELLKRHVFSYKGRIDLDNCDVIDIPDGKDAQYNVTVKHGWKFHERHKDKWYLVYAKTEAVKNHWLKAIKNERKRVLEDQENNFCVPDHWKQTVLNKVRSQSSLKDKQSGGRLSHGQLMLQRDSKDFTYSTLPRLRSAQKHDNKKKGWFKFGAGKKNKR